MTCFTEHKTVRQQCLPHPICSQPANQRPSQPANQPQLTNTPMLVPTYWYLLLILLHHLTISGLWPIFCIMGAISFYLLSPSLSPSLSLAQPASGERWMVNGADNKRTTCINFGTLYPGCFVFFVVAFISLDLHTSTRKESTSAQHSARPPQNTYVITYIHTDHGMGKCDGISDFHVPSSLPHLVHHRVRVLLWPTCCCCCCCCCCCFSCGLRSSSRRVELSWPDCLPERRGIWIATMGGVVLGICHWRNSKCLNCNIWNHNKSWVPLPLWFHVMESYLET